MIQRMGIYEKGCKLIVSVPLLCPSKRNNLLVEPRLEHLPFLIVLV